MEKELEHLEAEEVGNSRHFNRHRISTLKHLKDKQIAL